MHILPINIETLGDTPLPTYAKSGDSGFDLRASIPEYIEPHQIKIVPTGIKIAVPVGYEMQVRTRSGSALNQGYIVANSPGTVDSGYRGEVGVLIYNISDEGIYINPGDRIAQGVICPIVQAQFRLMTALDPTDRGEGGFGSTGVK